jgi:hypothetical protein
LVSGMRKKEENKWPRKLWNLERMVVIRNPIIKRKVQIATYKVKSKWKHIEKEARRLLQRMTIRK